MSELTRLRALVHQYAASLNRRAQVEQELLDAAAGKLKFTASSLQLDPTLPVTAAMLREWAMRLAVPDDAELRQAIDMQLLAGAIAPAGERVNHPRHYNQHPAGVECIDIIEHMSFNTGTAIKYLWRAGLKEGSPELEDLRKATWYIEREIERLQAAGNPGTAA